MVSRDTEEQQGTRLVEPDSEVGDYELRVDTEGIALGPMPSALRSKKTGQFHDLDIDFDPTHLPRPEDMVLTPQMFRQGYRYNKSLGPPISRTMTERAMNQAQRAIEFIDQFNPAMAQRLSSSPDLMFIVPEVAASVNEIMVDANQLMGGSATAQIMEALGTEDHRVFTKESLSQVLASTPVSAQFLHDYGDVFPGTERNMVGSMLALTPSRWRDRIAGLATRYLMENEDELRTSEEARNDFYVWMYNETRNQREGEQLAQSGIGKAFDALSRPYYAVQGGATRLYNKIISPEDVAWRDSLTPGQTISISMGSDPSDRWWTWQSGALDFVGTFVLDPINVVAGVSLGAKTARVFPMAAELASKNRAARMAQSVIPLVGRRTTPNLPMGTRSAWQRLGYHLTSATVEDAMKSAGVQRFTVAAAKHFEQGGNLAGLVEKFPQLKPLMGEGGGALRLLESTDPQIVEDGLKLVLTGQSENVVSTVENVRRIYSRRMQQLNLAIDTKLRRGEIGVDDLTAIDSVGGSRVTILDGPQTRHMVVRNATDADDLTKARTVFTQELREMDMTDPERVGNTLDLVSVFARDPDDPILVANETRVIRTQFNPETGEFELWSELWPVETVQAGQRISDAAQAAQDAAIRTTGMETVKWDKPNIRRVRIRIDGEAPMWTQALTGAHQVRDPETGKLQPVSAEIRQFIKDSIRTGEVDEVRAAEINRKVGLPGTLYGGFGPAFGSEVFAPRLGPKGKRYQSTDYVRVATYGEPSLDDTEAIGMLFPRAMYATDDANLANRFDDLGNPLSEGGFPTPTEYVIWDLKRDPVMLDINEGHDFVRSAVRTEVSKWRTKQELVNTLSDEELMDVGRYLEDNIYSKLEPGQAGPELPAYTNPFDGKFAEMYDKQVAQFAKSAEKRNGRELADFEMAEIHRRAVDVVAQEAGLDASIKAAEPKAAEAFRAREGRDWTPQENLEWRQQFSDKQGEEIRETLFRRREQYEGSAMSFEGADEYWEDVYLMPGWEAVERADQKHTRFKFLVQQDIDSLIRRAETEDWSDMQLLYSLQQTMVSGGVEGRIVNSTMFKIQERLRELGYDGFRYGRGDKVPAVPHLQRVEQLKDASRRHRARMEEIRTQFGEGHLQQMDAGDFDQPGTARRPRPEIADDLLPLTDERGNVIGYRETYTTDEGGSGVRSVTDPNSTNFDERVAQAVEIERQWKADLKAWEAENIARSQGRPRYIEGTDDFGPNGPRVVYEGEPFEVSTRGDELGKQFSAFNARIEGRGGRSIEEIYQTDVKGYDSIKAGKGKPPKDKSVDTKAAYEALWRQWANENPDKMEELYQATLAQGRPLRDRFAKKGANNQAEVLTKLLRERFADRGYDTATLKGRLASTNLKTGQIRLDEDAIRADWDGDLQYLRGMMGQNSKNQARILEEAGWTPETFKRVVEERFPDDPAQGYLEFILQHERWHAANPSAKGFKAEQEATSQALHWLVRQGEDAPAPQRMNPEYLRLKQEELERYRAERRRIRKAETSESQIFGFFGAGKGGQYMPSSLRVERKGQYIEAAVPSTEAARELFKRLGGEWFYQLKKSEQKKYLEAFPEVKSLLESEGATGLGIPMQDLEGFGLRPRELPSNIDPETGRALPNLSLDAPVAGTEGISMVDVLDESGMPTSRSATPLGPEGTGARAATPPTGVQGSLPLDLGEAAEVPPMVGTEPLLPSAADVGVQQRLPINPAPMFSDRELDLLVQVAQSQGYDSIKFAGDWSVLTPKGREKARQVLPGKSNADMTELNRLRAKAVQARLALDWAESIQDTGFFALKEMPRLPSVALQVFGDLTKPNTMDNWFGNWSRRLGAGLTELAAPEGITFTDTKQGYQDLRLLLRHFGVRETSMTDYLNRFIEAPVSERWGLLNDILREVADEIDHPILRARIKDWTDSGGLQSYMPTVDGQGKTVERTVVQSKSDPNRLAHRPGLPSHMSNVYPLPGQEVFKMLTRYRRGKALPRTLVNFMSRAGGTHAKRMEMGKTIVNKLADQGIDVSLEEALTFGYAAAIGPDEVGWLTKAMRAVGQPTWRGFHRAFTTIQLAARPFTWMFRVAVYDEAARGALFGATSMYKNPFEWAKVALVDNVRIQRIEPRRRSLVRAVANEAPAVFDNIDDPAQALDAVLEIVPGFMSHFGRLGFDDFDDLNQIKAAFYKVLAEDTFDAQYLDLSRFSQRLRSARNKVTKSEGTLTSYGLPLDFDWYDDAPEIMQKGLVSMIQRHGEATFKPLEWRPGAMTKTDQSQYALSYGGQLHTFITDPFGRVALSELAAREAGTSGNGHLKIVSNSHWNSYKHVAAELAEYNGFKWGNEGQLARWYLDNILIPQAEDLTRPLAGQNLRDFLLAMAHNKAKATIGERTYPLHARKDNAYKFIKQIENLVLDNPNHQFPARVAGQFDPVHAMPTATALPRRAADAIINTFGERATQFINRRPAYLKFYKKELDYMLSRGFDQSLAEGVARSEAARRVNHIYFNMKDVPHYIEQMNKVIPFFSAMYEVSTSWAYKIPLAQSGLGWPGGVAVLGRKVDRFIQMLIRSGIVEVEGEPDEDSPWDTRALRIKVGGTFGTNVEAAEMYGKASRAMMAFPEVLVRLLTGVMNDAPHPDGIIPEGGYTVSIGNPLDPLSHGLGSALNFSAGLNPLGSMALANVRNSSFWAGGDRRESAASGTTLEEFATTHDVSPQELLNWNAQYLVEKGELTRDEINLMRRGILPMDFSFSEDLSLLLPRSSFVGAMLDRVFFPFDQVESGVGTLNGYIPSWMNFFLRGWGIHNAVGDGPAYEVLDDGRVVFNQEDDYSLTTFSNFYINTFLPPETRTMMAGDVVLAMQHLEASEGLVSEYFALTTEYEDLKMAMFEEGLRYEEGQNGLEIYNRNEFPEASAQLDALKLDIQNQSALIVKRASEIAGTTSLIRGVAGFFGPANPRFLYEEAEKRALYYQSREAVEDWVREGGDIMRRDADGNLVELDLPQIGGKKDLDSFFTLAEMWADDMSGDGPQRFFKDQYKTAVAFLKGKTYWGPGGEPLISESYSQYVDLIREGEVLPYSGEVAQLLMLKTDMEISREVDIIDAYGSDPAQAASNMLYNWFEYTETIQSDYNTKRDEFDLIDEQLGNVWDDFAGRTRENFPVFSDEFTELFGYIDRDIDLAAEALRLNPELADDSELAQSIEELEAAASGLRQLRDRFELRPLEVRVKNPREALITQFFDQTQAPYYEMQANFRKRLLDAQTTEERATIFFEMRRWENQLAKQEAYVITPQGNYVRVPNGLEFRSISSGQEVQDGFIARNLNGNPVWNSLFDNQQLVERYPQMGGLVPTTEAEMRDYDVYENARIRIDTEVEQGIHSSYEGSQMKRQLEEEFRARLRASGREDEEKYMFDATPAERLIMAGIVTDPWMVGRTNQFREIIDFARAEEIGVNGVYTQPAYKMVLAEFKEKYATDNSFADMIDSLASTLGYEPGEFMIDEWFPSFFIGIYGSEF